MNIQLSIIGIGLIALFYCVGFAILIPLWRRLSPGWLRWTVITSLAFLVLALPVADEVWITWHFNEYCKDAGVHVMRKVAVEGYYDSTTTGWSKPQIVTDPQLIAEYEKVGFRFRERNTSLSRDEPNKISHLEKYPDGTWRITVLNQPTARYHYKHAYQPTQHETEEPVGWKLGKSEYIIIDSATSAILGRDTRYIRYPGWIDGLLIRYLGSGMTTCEGGAPKPPDLRYPLHKYVFIPTGSH